MTNKIILLITILAYSMVVSQPFMYILSLRYAQMHLEGNGYLQLRQLIDVAMRNGFKYVLYTSTFATIALMIMNIKQPGSLAFITAAVAFVALVAEILLTVKGSLPINDVINGWSAGHMPADWTNYRSKWFQVFQYRQVVSIAGFVSLIIGTVFGKS